MRFRVAEEEENCPWGSESGKVAGDRRRATELAELLAEMSAAGEESTLGIAAWGRTTLTTLSLYFQKLTL